MAITVTLALPVWVLMRALGFGMTAADSGDILSLRAQMTQQPARPHWTGFQEVSFETLGGFNYGTGASDALKANVVRPLPRNVRALNGHKISITGYIIPIDYEQHEVKSFALVKDQMSCCFGVAPKMNHWIYVTCDEPQHMVNMTNGAPVTVAGRLQVGEKTEKGMVVSLYRMQAVDTAPGGG